MLQRLKFILQALRKPVKAKDREGSKRVRKRQRR